MLQQPESKVQKIVVRACAHAFLTSWESKGIAEKPCSGVGRRGHRGDLMYSLGGLDLCLEMIIWILVDDRNTI